MSAQTTDLSARAQVAWDHLAWGFSELRRCLGTKRLWPEVFRLAATPDGVRWRVTGDRRVRVEGGAPQALLVPGRDVLWGDLRLPGVSRASLSAAVSEALWRVSPLPPDQVAAAWRAQPDETGGWRVLWGVCPLRAVEQGLAQLQLPEDSPVYLAHDEAEALLVQGSATLAHCREQRRFDALTLGGLLLLLAAVSVPVAMPLVLKRQAVVRGMAHMATVEPMAAPVRQKLDELNRLASLSDGLTAERQQSLPVASVLDRLAEALPADAWLDRLEASDRQVRFMGLTPNATELMTRLSRVPEFSELRTIAPTVRDEGQNRERLSVEFTWRDAPNGVAAK